AMIAGGRAVEDDVVVLITLPLHRANLGKTPFHPVIALGVAEELVVADFFGIGTGDFIEEAVALGILNDAAAKEDHLAQVAGAEDGLVVYLARKGLQADAVRKPLIAGVHGGQRMGQGHEVEGFSLIREPTQVAMIDVAPVG